MFTFPARGVGLTLSKMRGERGDIKAQIEVTEGKRTIHWGNLYLGSVSGRSSLAKDLGKITNHFDWQMALNWACQQASVEYHRPQPTVNLAGVETNGDRLTWLIERFLPKGEITYLFADGGSAKSLTAMWLALACSRGAHLPHGLTVTEPTEVLFLDWETNDVTAARRLRRLSKGMDCPIPNIHYRACRRTLGDEMDTIRRDIASLGIGLVIVDSIGMAVGSDLNAAETANQANHMLRSLPATKLVLAHVSHASAQSERSGAAPFGSRFFHNGARATWELRRVEDDSDSDVFQVGFFQAKFNEGARVKEGLGFEVVFDGDDGPITFKRSELAEEPSLRQRLPVSVQITSVLRRGSRSTAEIAEELDIKPDTVKKTLSRMATVVRLSEGSGRGNSTVWGLAESPR